MHDDHDHSHDHDAHSHDHSHGATHTHEPLVPELVGEKRGWLAAAPDAAFRVKDVAGVLHPLR